MRLVVFHTNDFHNRLTPEKARRIKEYREAIADSLLVDAGDAIGAGNLTSRRREPCLELMNSLHYTAMVMGNRESHPTHRVLATKLRGVHFPVLASNLMTKRGKTPAMVRDSLTVSANGVTIGLLGLAPEVTRPDSWWARFTDFIFDDPIKTATGLVKKLRGQCAVVICLSHLGLAKDRELAERVPGIDLIVGGHSHVELHEPERVGRTTIVSTGAYARWLGKVEVDLRDGKVGTIRGELLAL